MYCNDVRAVISSDVTDSSYERAVEGDRRGSVPTVSISRPTFSLSPTEEVSDQASISSSYSESKVRHSYCELVVVTVS